MQEAEVIVPAVETLVRVEGTLDRPVCHIRFEKITFSYTTWMRPSEKGHVPLQAGMYLTDGYRIDPKMQRNYLNHPLDNQGWLGLSRTIRVWWADGGKGVPSRHRSVRAGRWRSSPCPSGKPQAAADRPPP